MIKNDVFVIGIGLGGENVAHSLQQKNYSSYLINGSKQDNKTLLNAKNVLVLEGYDGLAGDRELAFEALKNNKDIIKKISEIKEKVILLVATGGGTTGSGSIPHIANIVSALPNKIVCAALMMPRADEAIQKRLNAYNTAKELMEIQEMGAIMFVNNEYSDELDKINYNLVNMLDAFFSDDSSSATSNFDDSEKLKMLSDNGAFIISMRSDNKVSKQEEADKKISTQEMVNTLTAKNIFLPINNDKIVAHIGMINQKGNHIDEQEIIKAVGNPENIFIGNNGTANIVCASGLGFPVEYISNLGKTALKEQKERIEKRKSFSILEDLEDIENEPKMPEKRGVNKRRQVSLDLLRELD
ncbi:hypothetical protein [Kineothrix sp. MB12-C1]|uniref:hypothetical protein n=1 Tax=Kineothrix sp. MB12-C1 TaxID=3070215 RepID=UPI0027D23BDC|nr:hypothetical protein [Kineothrix sp. MB12-C1]WMC93211.1 hypothetical protein RBB56_02695 [Kineothrix sp. MB12-C1]